MNPIKNDQPTATARITPSRASIGPERRMTKRRFSPEGWETADLRGLRKGAAIHYPPSCGKLQGPGLTVKAHPVRGRQSTRKASSKTRLNGNRHRADLSHAEYSTFMQTAGMVLRECPHRSHLAGSNRRCFRSRTVQNPVYTNVTCFPGRSRQARPDRCAAPDRWNAGGQGGPWCGARHRPAAPDAWHSSCAAARPVP